METTKHGSPALIESNESRIEYRVNPSSLVIRSHVGGVDSTPRDLKEGNRLSGSGLKMEIELRYPLSESVGDLV